MSGYTPKYAPPAVVPRRMHATADMNIAPMIDGALRYGEVIAVIDVAKGAGVDRVGIITPAMRGR